MSFSKESLAKIDAAQAFILFSDDYTENGGVFFIVALLEKMASKTSKRWPYDHKLFTITNEDGSRSENHDRFIIMGAIQALRPELETHDFYRGHVQHGPYASDLNRELTSWLLSLSGRALSSLDDVELMAVSEGYEQGEKLGLVVTINDTNEPPSVIKQQLRKRDRQSPLLKSGAIIQVINIEKAEK